MTPEYRKQVLIEVFSRGNTFGFAVMGLDVEPWVLWCGGSISLH